MILENEISDRAHYALFHSPFSAAFEQAERELGERIGYPALVYESGPYHTAQASPGYEEVFSPAGLELSAQEQAARLNRQEEEIAGLRAANKTGVENLENAMAIEVDLRFQLASAHEHVGALTKALDSVIAWIEVRATVSPDIRSTLSAARAWLRREA